MIEFRAFDVAGCRGRLFAHLKDDLEPVRAFWQEHQAHNLYWGVSTRRDDTSGTLEESEVKQILHNALTQPDRPLPTPQRVRVEAAADAQ